MSNDVFERQWLISLFFFHSTPFNGNTLLGWAAIFCLNLIFGPSYLITNIPTATFFLATGFYFEACANHFQTLFDDMTTKYPDHSMFEIRLEVKKALIEAVNFHITIKRWTFLWFAGNCRVLCEVWWSLMNFSIFEIMRALMSATIFFELLVGILYMAVLNSSLEIVRLTEKSSKFAVLYQQWFYIVAGHPKYGSENCYNNSWFADEHWYGTFVLLRWIADDKSISPLRWHCVRVHLV